MDSGEPRVVSDDQHLEELMDVTRAGRVRTAQGQDAELSGTEKSSID